MYAQSGVAAEPWTTTVGIVSNMLHGTDLPADHTNYRK
jgi:hypothetical protein